MAILKGALLVMGVLVIAMGLLWTGQGLGIIMWPSSSFMLADRQWAINGAITVLVGIVMIVVARRKRA